MRGATFIDGVIKGDKERGEKSQLIAEPLIIAPNLRFRVGVINGVPFSRDMFGAGWFVRYKRQKDVSRAE